MFQRRSESALVFMVKWPEAGRAKTRLSPPLTPIEAAELARCSLLDTLAEAANSGADCLLAYAPARARACFESLAGPRVALIEAEMPDLGQSLQRAQTAALALGYRRVALVASDLPHLPRRRYLDAWAGLAGADLVIGPSGDGGYYLLAAERQTPHLFEGIAWSTATVYAETLQRAAEAALTVHVIEPCDDIDTGQGLSPLFATLARQPGAGHTLAFLLQLPFFQTELV